MNLTIIPIDKIVYINNESFTPLEFFYPKNVHALQWKDTKGWIEYSEDNEGIKKPNELIDSLPEWANIAIQKWNIANENELAIVAEEERLAEELRLTETNNI